MIEEVSQEYFVQEITKAGQGIKHHYSKFAVIKTQATTDDVSQSD